MYMSEKLIDKIVKLLEEESLPVVVASRGGKSALKLQKRLGKKARVVAVSEFKYEEGLRKDLEKGGGSVVEEADLVLQDLPSSRKAVEVFGGGVKAALEASIMAAEKGVIDGRFVAVAGEGGKLDTALVVELQKEKASMDLLGSLKVKRILSSPLTE